MKPAKINTVLIMAGGTGGHVFPALSIAKALKEQAIAVHWLGTRSGIEHQLVVAAGYPISYISAVSLRGTTLLQRIILPARLLMVLLRTWMIFLKLSPDVVLGMGGYVSAPGGVLAWLMRKPLVIHEQNSVPGLTNRWLAKLAKQRLCAFPEAFAQCLGGEAAVVVTGNPVRQEIIDIESPEKRFKGRDGKLLRLLVLGGSQGARPINQVMPGVLAQLASEKFLEVWHQTGKQGYEAVIADYQARGVEVEGIKVAPFIEDMAAAYAWADVVLCRSGAMTLAELMAVGVGSILVPLPHSADNHQFFNARYLVERQGAVLLEQKELEVGRVVGLLRELQGDRGLLLALALAARGAGRSDAVAKITGVICQYF